MADRDITTGAVCVYSSRVPDAVKTLKDIESKVQLLEWQQDFQRVGTDSFIHFFIMHYLKILHQLQDR